MHVKEGHFISFVAGTLRRRGLPLWSFLCIAVLLGAASPGHCNPFDSLITPDMKSLEARCRKGELSLCTSAGNIYRSGAQKVPKDIDKAIELYGLGCSGGESKCCQALYFIGFDDSRGKKVKRDLPRAARVLTEACKGSPSGIYSGPACHELAKLYISGKSVQKDITRGVDLLRRGCDRHSLPACRDLGNILLEGSHAPKDVGGAIDAYRKACGGKKPEHRACMQLGTLFLKGEQVEKDIPSAEKYLTEACSFPDQIGTACYELARLYDSGLAGGKSAEEITELYHVACDRAKEERSARACIAAAKRHLAGKGTKKDPNWVSQLYNRGCMMRDRESCRLSCEWNCKKGQPHACAAIKSGRIPLGVSNCFKP